MKGIFVVFAAVCLGACASQPGKISATSAASAGNGVAATNSAQPERRTERVYLDDYERVLIQAPQRDRQAIVLGANRGRQ